MSTRIRSLVSGIAVILLASGVAGAENPLFTEHFDDYALGSDIIGQGNWVAWDHGADPSVGAFVSDTFALSSPHSLEIGKPDMTDVVWEFSDLIEGEYTFSAKTYVPSSTDMGWSDINVMNQHPAPFDWLGTLRFEFDTGIVRMLDNSGTAATLINDEWIEARIEFDIDNFTADFYYDDTLISPEEGRVWDGNQELVAINLYSDPGTLPMYYDDLGPPPGVVTVPGDVDGDDDVDLQDLGYFEAQFGMSGLPVPPIGPNSADLDEDGDVDLDDLKIMRDYWGAAPAAPAATPEPATVTLLALGGLMVLRRRRLRH